jgi:hypothetical protein
MTVSGAKERAWLHTADDGNRCTEIITSRTFVTAISLYQTFCFSDLCSFMRIEKLGTLIMRAKTIDFQKSTLHDFSESTASGSSRRFFDGLTGRPNFISSPLRLIDASLVRALMKSGAISVSKTFAKYKCSSRSRAFLLYLLQIKRVV